MPYQICFLFWLLIGWMDEYIGVPPINSNTSKHQFINEKYILVLVIALHAGNTSTS